MERTTAVTPASADTPLVAGPLYGLRSWRVVAGPDGERLAAPQRGTPWPTGGAWLEASCDRTTAHAPPAPGCDCGAHAWHPTRRSARRLLSVRQTVAGVMEAEGAVEVHLDGFRAQRARPYALALLPGRNAARVRRLAERHAAQVVEVRGADDLVAWCRERGLGLDPAAVAELLGPETKAELVRARTARARRTVLRLAAAVALAGALVAAALALGPTTPEDTPPGRYVDVPER